MKKNSEESKYRILAAAVRTFAEKGYSGARVDQIAKEAGVNKALIYYYFDNKEAILGELFKTFFRRSSEMLLDFIERGGFTENPQENKRMFETEYIRYLESSRDLLKIIVMESLKDEGPDTPLFKLVDIGGNVPAGRVENIVASAAMSETDRKQMLVTEFFTGVMPFVCYIVLKDKWCAHFNMDESELKACFDKAMEETHEQHHKNEDGGIV
jgi:TetR/AcrR family transcriptional regulator